MPVLASIAIACLRVLSLLGIGVAGAALLLFPESLDLYWLSVGLWLTLALLCWRWLAPQRRNRRDAPDADVFGALGMDACDAWGDAGADACADTYSEHAPAAAGSGAENGTGWHVLIAQADVGLAVHLGAILRQAGHRCSLARNGMQALELLAQLELDAAIMATHLPWMNGLEVLKAYRFMRHKEVRLPIIMTGAAALKGGAHSAGADAYLGASTETDIEADKLLETLKDLIGPVREAAAAVCNPLPLADEKDLVVLDLAILAELEIVSQDPQWLDGLLVGCMVENRKLVERLRQSLAQMRIAESREILHALKGAALSIGALRFKAACLRGERMAPAQMRRDWRRIHHDIQRELDCLDQALIQYRRQRNGAQHNAGNREEQA